MPGRPKISLLMTAYNSERFIASAIDSTLAQILSNFELIIRDDGSQDRTLEIVKGYDDPRITLIEGEHVGMARGYNETITRVAGEYIGFLDSDDMLEPSALEEASRVLDEDPDAAMVYTDYYDMSEDGRKLTYGTRCKVPYSPKRLLVDLMTFHFRLFRRSTFDKIGVFDPELEMAFDYDLCLRISEKHKIIHLARPLYKYRRHEGSVSIKRTAEQIQDSRKAVERALERRGLSDEYELQIRIFPKFRIVKI